MHNEINISDLIKLSDDLKVLVIGIYEYENENYLLVRRVNDMETITIGDSFFLKILDNSKEIECEYVGDDSLIYSLMKMSGSTMQI